MTKEQWAVQRKLRIRRHAKESGHFAKTRRYFGVGRSSSIVGLALIFVLGVGPIRLVGQEEERPKMNIELQFTESFTGQKISIRVEGEIVADFTAQTKFQTGLAHIEMLDLRDGEEVTVTISEPEIELRLDIDASQPFMTFSLQDGILSVSKTGKRPGYL